MCRGVGRQRSGSAREQRREESTCHSTDNTAISMDGETPARACMREKRGRGVLCVRVEEKKGSRSLSKRSVCAAHDVPEPL